MSKQIQMAGIDNKLSRSADEYLDIIEEIESLKVKLEIQGNELMEAMNEAKKTKLKHRGRTIKLSYIEAKWKVQATKEVKE